ncbi:dna topoisomerase 2 [Quercus suber]|uniref:Dna topoisomerase 2 n=1 Tax=Quercus suber TaxID=58331 RepID=A0AAW0M571_QUESU
MPEYESWKHNLTGNASGWSIKYYKAKYIKFKVVREVLVNAWNFFEGLFVRDVVIGGDIAILGQNIQDDDVNSNSQPHDMT